MKPCSTMYQIHDRQARSPAESNDAGGGGVGAQSVAVSALAVPDDPLDGIMQCLGAEKGFADDCWATGAWFDDYRGGSMDMSTQAGVDYFEMLLDLPDATPVLASEGATETAPTPTPTPTGTRVAAVQDWPARTTNLAPSLSSSDGDDGSWMSSSDSPSEDDDADTHWLPCVSKKSGGTKRRLQQQCASRGQSKQETQTFVRPPPLSVVAVVEGGGGGDSSYWCHHCLTTKSPLWRAGPDGPKTLCNACGLRKNKLGAPTTTKRLPAAKPSIGNAKSNNYPVMPLGGGATVVRKKRSVAIRIG